MNYSYLLKDLCHSPTETVLNVGMMLHTINKAKNKHHEQHLKITNSEKTSNDTKLNLHLKKRGKVLRICAPQYELSRLSISNNGM